MKEDKWTESDRKQGATLDWVLRNDLFDQIAFEQGPKGNEGKGHVDNQEKRIPDRRKVHAKVLR